MKELLTSELKRYARKFPKTVKFILDNYSENLRCRCCNGIILKEQEIETYPYFCVHCYENMYLFETLKSTKKITNEELEEFVYKTNEIFLLDEIHEIYFLKKIASRILLDKNILLGYELEGSSFEIEDDIELKQFIVRIPTGENFSELWEYGREHCSKFTIYLNCENVFVERRPDMNNYQIYNDLMYGKDDIITAGKVYDEHVRKSLYSTNEEYEKYLKGNKKMLSKRIKYVLDNLVGIKELGNDNFNILYKE